MAAKCACGNDAWFIGYGDTEPICLACAIASELPDDTELVDLYSGEILKLGALRREDGVAMFFDAEIEPIQWFVDDGYIVIDGVRYRLTE